MRIVIPTSRAVAEHAKALTVRLREDEPPAGLASNESICPVCLLTFCKPGDWGLCPDCTGDLKKV